MQSTLPVKDINLDVTVPIDMPTAVENLGGEASMFYSMLSKFESMTLETTLRDMISAYDNVDYEQLKNYAHSLKGASGYIGASRLYYQCYFIQ